MVFLRACQVRKILDVLECFLGMLEKTKDKKDGVDSTPETKLGQPQAAGAFVSETCAGGSEVFLAFI